MAGTFSLFTDQPSRLHRLHPLTKLALAGLVLAGGLAAPGAWAAFVFFAVVVMPLALAGRVAGRLARAALVVVLPFAVSVFLIQGFLWPGGTPVWAIGPFSLKREGVLFASAAAGRILLMVSGFLLLALTTRPDHLMAALTQRGLSPSLAYLVVATIQIVPRFQARATAILDAQRARGLETTGSLLRRARAVLPLVAPLILSSLAEVEERALAIEARAFNHPGPKTSLVPLPQAAWEPAARWLLVLAAAGLPLARLLWWAA